MPLEDALLAQLDDTVTYEDGGQKLPVRQHPFVRDIPDFKTLVQRGLEAHREVGARIPLRVKDDNERAEWRKTHLPKLYDAGILPKPLASPDEYVDVVKRPESIPDGWGWNDDLAKDMRTLAHKHNLSKDVVKDLLGLHERTMIGASNVLKTSMEEAERALKTEFGADYETLAAAVPRLLPTIFKTPEERALFEDSGFGNHPGFLGVLMRMAKLVQSDSSFFVQQNQNGDGTNSGATMTAEQVRAEIAKYYDPKHPDHAAYMRNDPVVMAKIDELYKRAGFTKAPVEII